MSELPICNRMVGHLLSRKFDYPHEQLKQLVRSFKGSAEELRAELRMCGCPEMMLEYFLEKRGGPRIARSSMATSRGSIAISTPIDRDDERKKLERKLHFLQQRGKAGGVAWRKTQRKLKKLGK